MRAALGMPVVPEVKISSAGVMGADVLADDLVRRQLTAALERLNEIALVAVRRAEDPLGQGFVEQRLDGLEDR